MLLSSWFLTFWQYSHVTYPLEGWLFDPWLLQSTYIPNILTCRKKSLCEWGKFCKVLLVLSRKTLYKKQSVSSPLRVSLWGWCFWVVRLFNHKQDVLLVYIIFLQVVLEFSLGLRVKSFTCILAAVQGTLDTLLTSFLWISLPTSTRLVLYRVPLFGLSLVTPVFDTWKHHVYRSQF